MQEPSRNICFGWVSLPVLASEEYFVSLFALLVIQLFPKTFFSAPACNKTQLGLLTYIASTVHCSGKTLLFALSSEPPGSISKQPTLQSQHHGFSAFSGTPPLALLSLVSSPVRGNHELVLKWGQLAIGQTRKHWPPTANHLCNTMLILVLDTSRAETP